MHMVGGGCEERERERDAYKVQTFKMSLMFLLGLLTI